MLKKIVFNQNEQKIGISIFWSLINKGNTNQNQKLNKII